MKSIIDDVILPINSLIFSVTNVIKYFSYHTAI